MGQNINMRFSTKMYRKITEKQAKSREVME